MFVIGCAVPARMRAASAVSDVCTNGEPSARSTIPPEGYWTKGLTMSTETVASQVLTPVTNVGSVSQVESTKEEPLLSNCAISESLAGSVPR